MILKTLSSVNTPLITCSKSIGTSTPAGESHPSFLLAPYPSILSILPYIMLYNALKAWKPTKMLQEKSDYSDHNVTPTDLKNLLKEFHFRTLMAMNSLSWYLSLLKLKKDGFLQSHNLVCILDLFISQWRTHWELKALVNLNFWFLAALLVLIILQVSNPFHFHVESELLDQLQEELVCTKLEGIYIIYQRNYGPTLGVTKEANKKGHQQVLWLYDDRKIIEVGASNIFFVFKSNNGKKAEIVTPAL